MVEHVHAHPLRAVDANGDPVSGALMYVYLTGTLTLATVYSDLAETIAHASPIVADSSGFFPPIYHSGAQLKVNVTDPDGVDLPGYPIDPVPTISTSASGAADVSFDPYTGFTDTNVQDAIESLMARWNATSEWSGDFNEAEDAAAAREVLGLGGLATLDVLDEDDFATDSATRPPSQQSAKAYISSRLGARGIRPVAVLEEQKSTGTNAMTVTASAWNTRQINAEVRDDLNIVSIAGFAFTPTQNAWCEWEAPMRDPGVTRLWNVTDGAQVAISHNVGGTGGGVSISTGGGDLVAGKAYRIEQWATNTVPAAYAAGAGGNEIYTRVRLWLR